MITKADDRCYLEFVVHARFELGEGIKESHFMDLIDEFFHFSGDLLGHNLLRLDLLKLVLDVHLVN